MKQFLPLVVVAAALIIAGTYFQGVYSERWRPMDSDILDQFASRVELVPRQIGQWTGTDDEDISEEEWKATNCKAYVSRSYVHKDTGDRVSFYLVAGTARHITIHQPTWCYVGAGFKQKGETGAHEVTIDDEVAEFATAVFVKPQSALRIFWTYSDDGTWLGPQHPNYTKAKFGGRPAMFKIYLIGSATENASESPCGNFARDVFPTLNDVLFSAANTPSADSSTDLEL